VDYYTLLLNNRNVNESSISDVDEKTGIVLP
jgi:hypothetical protein